MVKAGRSGEPRLSSIRIHSMDEVACCSRFPGGFPLNGPCLHGLQGLQAAQAARLPVQPQLASARQPCPQARAHLADLAFRGSVACRQVASGRCRQSGPKASSGSTGSSGTAPEAFLLSLRGSSASPPLVLKIGGRFPSLPSRGRSRARLLRGVQPDLGESQAGPGPGPGRRLSRGGDAGERSSAPSSQSQRSEPALRQLSLRFRCSASLLSLCNSLCLRFEVKAYLDGAAKSLGDGKAKQAPAKAAFRLALWWAEGKRRKPFEDSRIRIRSRSTGLTLRAPVRERGLGVD